MISVDRHDERCRDIDVIRVAAGGASGGTYDLDRSPRVLRRHKAVENDSVGNFAGQCERFRPGDPEIDRDGRAQGREVH